MPTTTPIAFVFALQAKKQTLLARIDRYTEYLAADDKLLTESNNPQKHIARRRNHEEKLKRAQRQLAGIENALHQATAQQSEQTEQLTLTLAETERAKIHLNITTPTGTEQCQAIKLSNIFHLRIDELSIKAEAWVRCANLLHLTKSIVTKLRKGKEHIVKFSPRHIKTFMQQVHTDRNGMHTRTGTPNLANT